MNSISISDVRNFAIMGHTGSGKTTLTDALLFKLGLNDRLGSVDSGSSMGDYTEQEKDRKTTIFSKPFGGIYKAGGKNLQLVFTDTPGYVDFYGQIVAASRSTEAVLIAIDAAAGIQVGTHRAWRLCKNNELARGIVVNGLDRDNTDYQKVLENIQSHFGSACVPVVLPLPDGKGVFDVLAGGKAPSGMEKQVDEARNKLMELAAETDDSLIEKFLGGSELTADEMVNGLRIALVSGSFVPVFACMPLKDIGVSELADGIGRLFPSPGDVQPVDAEGGKIATGKNDPFVGHVWRTVNDPFIGQLVFLRVLGGTLKSESEVFNSIKGEKERIGSILLVNGKTQTQLTEASAGDIIALPKLKVTTMGDTLCAMGKNTVCKPIAFPGPVVFQSIKAKTQADEDRIGIALGRVSSEDHTLRVERNTETKEMILGGMGDVHIDVAVGLMKSRSNVEVVLDTPKIPYRETVTTRGEGHYKHKKQSGGRGQYGEVYLRVEPKRESDEDWFVNELVGGSIPGSFVPAIQKGLVEGMTSGALAGYPVMNVKASVYDGSFHDVDSSEIAFKIAGSRAFKEGMLNAKPVLLEPIMTVKVIVPEQYMGDINGDLNHKRGRILGMSIEDGMQVVSADVPKSELFRYAAELRSMTAGQGTFEMEFSRYEIVPSNIAQKIIAAAQKGKEAEEE